MPGIFAIGIIILVIVVLIIGALFLFSNKTEKDDKHKID